MFYHKVSQNFLIQISPSQKETIQLKVPSFVIKGQRSGQANLSIVKSTLMKIVHDLCIMSVMSGVEHVNVSQLRGRYEKKGQDT